MDDTNLSNIPDDMAEGTRHGMLVVSGEWEIDKFHNRKYKCLCDCGETVFLESKDIRKRECCCIKNHPEKRKLAKNKPKRIDIYTEQYIGARIRGCDVIGVSKSKYSFIFTLACVECGYVFDRKLTKFLNGKVGACPKNHAEDIARNEKKKEQKRIQKAKEAEERKQENIKKNHGMYRYTDITGMVFGRLTVVSFNGVHVTKGGTNNAMWNCVCECGGTCVVSYYGLKSGRMLCDKELLELKKKQGRKTAQWKIEESKKNGTYNDVSFRRRHSSKLSEFSQSIYYKYDGVCQSCKQYFDKQESHAHHIIPIQQNKKLAFTISNGILLCEKCHIELHKQFGFIGGNPKDMFIHIQENR